MSNWKPRNGVDARITKEWDEAIKEDKKNRRPLTKKEKLEFLKKIRQSGTIGTWSEGKTHKGFLHGDWLGKIVSGEEYFPKMSDDDVFKITNGLPESPYRWYWELKLMGYSLMNAKIAGIGKLPSFPSGIAGPGMPEGPTLVPTRTGLGNGLQFGDGGFGKVNSDTPYGNDTILNNMAKRFNSSIQGRIEQIQNKETPAPFEGGVYKGKLPPLTVSAADSGSNNNKGSKSSSSSSNSGSATSTTHNSSSGSSSSSSGASSSSSGGDDGGDERKRDRDDGQPHQDVIDELEFALGVNKKLSQQDLLHLFNSFFNANTEGGLSDFKLQEILNELGIKNRKGIRKKLKGQIWRNPQFQQRFRRMMERIGDHLGIDLNKVSKKPDFWKQFYEDQLNPNRELTTNKLIDIFKDYMKEPYKSYDNINIEDDGVGLGLEPIDANGDGEIDEKEYKDWDEEHGDEKEKWTNWGETDTDAAKGLGVIDRDEGGETGEGATLDDVDLNDPNIPAYVRPGDVLPPPPPDDGDDDVENDEGEEEEEEDPTGRGPPWWIPDKKVKTKDRTPSRDPSDPYRPDDSDDSDDSDAPLDPDHPTENVFYYNNKFRPMFKFGNPRKVFELTNVERKRELDEHELFNYVEPGFGEGSDNPLFINNLRNQQFRFNQETMNDYKKLPKVKRTSRRKVKRSQPYFTNIYQTGQKFRDAYDNKPFRKFREGMPTSQYPDEWINSNPNVYPEVAQYQSVKRRYDNEPNWVAPRPQFTDYREMERMKIYRD